jgi:hypothetical protein
VGHSQSVCVCRACWLGPWAFFFFDLGMLADVLGIPPDRFNIKTIFAFKRLQSQSWAGPTLLGWLGECFGCCVS